MYLYISFDVFLYDSLGMYDHANDIHEIDTVLVAGSYPSTRKDAGFFTFHLKPKLSPCIPHHVHTFYDECVCLFLWPVLQSIDRWCSYILCHHHKTPSQTSLPPEQIIFVFPPVHLSSLRCLIKSSFRVNICLQPLHSHCL